MTTVELALVGGVLSFSVVGILQVGLVSKAQKMNVSNNNTGRAVGLWNLIVTREDERYSLSRFQIYIWFVVATVSWGASSFALEKLGDIPEGLIYLMGLHGVVAITSTGIALQPSKQGLLKNPQSDPSPPSFFRDIFFRTDDSLDLPRTQMFVWTILILMAYIVMVIHNFAEGHRHLPDIPTSLVALMGTSHLLYVGSKAVEK
ncbi:MAG: hypothetical protein ACYC9S_03335 [Leptospirales bacterium]